MSLHLQIFDPIPPETLRVAQAAFPSPSLYMRMRDEFGNLYTDHDFEALFPPRGQPAEDPARLALVTMMQFVEGLSNRQATDTVRSRIDWKYALALELTDPGFDASVLCKFRARLIAAHAENRLFETLLHHLKQQGLLKARGRQRTDSTAVSEFPVRYFFTISIILGNQSLPYTLIDSTPAYGGDRFEECLCSFSHGTTVRQNLDFLRVGLPGPCTRTTLPSANC